jgi:predicted sulfurtransferase
MSSLEAIEKYEQKLAEGIKKRNYRKFIEDESDDDVDLEKKIKKYEHKIAKAKAAIIADTPSSSESASSEVSDNDKSGMSLLLFYAYVEPGWNSKQHHDTIKWAEGILSSNAVTGRLRVSREGFNGTLTGSYDGIRNWTSALRGYYNGYFKNMQDGDDFKYTDNLPAGQAFPKLKVFPVLELVNYGLGVDDPPPISTKGGVHLAPADYNNKLKEANTVVIDIRNTYEADIGRFQPVEGGAEYIDPKMRVSTEFPQWAKDNVERLKDKQVLMYCTGGIRCERASALFRSLGHDQVFQLKGGIHKYLEDFSDGAGSQWVGQNYTFDKRFAHGTAKKEDGEGEEGVGDVEEEKEVDEEKKEGNSTSVIGR